MSLKTIFISGATSGIGLETAKLFAQHGWRFNVAFTIKS